MLLPARDLVAHLDLAILKLIDAGFGCRCLISVEEHPRHRPNWVVVGIDDLRCHKLFPCFIELVDATRLEKQW